MTPPMRKIGTEYVKFENKVCCLMFVFIRKERKINF